MNKKEYNSRMTQYFNEQYFRASILAFMLAEVNETLKNSSAYKHSLKAKTNRYLEEVNPYVKDWLKFRDSAEDFEAYMSQLLIKLSYLDLEELTKFIVYAEQMKRDKYNLVFRIPIVKYKRKFKKLKDKIIKFFTR